MITNAQKVEQLTGVRKAAMVVVLLGDQTGGDIMRELTEDEVQRIAHEVATLRRIGSEQAETVLEEFYEMSVAREYALQGGIDFAKKVLIKAFGPEAAKRLVDLLMKTLGSQPANFDALQRADPQQLAKFVHNEHPQTIALILSHLNPSQAAALLASLPSGLRGDVALRMASLDQISPEVVQHIAEVIGKKLKNLGEYSRESYGGVRAVAEMCNRLDSGTSAQVIERIESENPPVAEMIRHLMFVFEDMLMIDEAGMREVVSRVDRKVLTTALKGTSDQLKNHFMQHMSQRAIETMKEDMDALGPIKVKTVAAAQQQIISTVRALEQQGVISLRGAVGEQFVV